MKREPRVLGVASAARACGLVVLEGSDIVYYWAVPYDRSKSPVQNFAAIRKRLVSVTNYLRPSQIALSMREYVRSRDRAIVDCVFAEAQWLARTHQIRFRSIDVHNRFRTNLRLAELSRMSLPTGARRSLHLAYEAAWAVYHRSNRAR
ncbi:MAG: hypothetical protein AMXMBFR82_07000 [Candidatus Hydrogenedentota bacterium]